jgi:hypothetical protein
VSSGFFKVLVNRVRKNIVTAYPYRFRRGGKEGGEYLRKAFSLYRRDPFRQPPFHKQGLSRCSRFWKSVSRTRKDSGPPVTRTGSPTAGTRTPGEIKRKAKITARYRLTEDSVSLLYPTNRSIPAFFNSSLSRVIRRRIRFGAVHSSGLHSVLLRFFSEPFVLSSPLNSKNSMTDPSLYS